MIHPTPYRRPTGVGAVNSIPAAIASIVLFCARHVASAQEAEHCSVDAHGAMMCRYVLSAGATGETVFWVLPNQIGIVPAEAEAFDAVAEQVEGGIGNTVLRKNKGQQIIIAGTISPEHRFRRYCSPSSKLNGKNWPKRKMGRTHYCYRRGCNVVMLPDIRDILLPTDVVIVKVRENVQKPDAVLARTGEIGLRLLDRHPPDGRKYYFELPPEREDINVISASQKLLEEKNRDIVEYAVPDTLIFVELRSSSLNDEFFDYQWPLNNTGQEGGVVDADIDADLAWSKFGLGNSSTIIAVLDDGFDMAHLDLAPNIFVNVDEQFGGNLRRR